MAQDLGGGPVTRHLMRTRSKRSLLEVEPVAGETNASGSASTREPASTAQPGSGTHLKVKDGDPVVPVIPQLPEEIYHFYILPQVLESLPIREQFRLGFVCRSWCRIVLRHIWRNVYLILDRQSSKKWLQLFQRPAESTFCPYGDYVESVSVFGGPDLEQIADRRVRTRNRPRLLNLGMARQPQQQQHYPSVHELLRMQSPEAMDMVDGIHPFRRRSASDSSSSSLGIPGGVHHGTNNNPLPELPRPPPAQNANPFLEDSDDAASDDSNDSFASGDSVTTPSIAKAYREQMKVLMATLSGGRFPQLRHLFFHGTPLMPEHFIPLALLRSTLRTLQFTESKYLNTYYSREYTQNGDHLRRLGELTELVDLRIWSYNLTDSIWKVLLLKLGRLQRIHFDQCHPRMFTKDSVLLLARLLPNLRSLVFSEQCSSLVDDECVKEIGQHCPELTHLEIPSCQITKRTLEIMSSLRIRETFEHLEHLNIQNNPQLTNLRPFLLAAPPKLRRVQVWGCHGCDKIKALIRDEKSGKFVNSPY